MRVTREFAQRHDRELPKGYADKNERAQKSQLSLYDKAQEQDTGVSKAERSDFITDCWKRRDTPGSFVAELQEGGYLLATGRRHYLLVDRFGHINSLARLINDPDVKLNHIRDFLGRDFPEDSLPDAEEIKKRLKGMAVSERSETQEYWRDRKEKLSALRVSQSLRRGKLAAEEGRLRTTQRREREKVLYNHQLKMSRLRSQYREEKAQQNSSPRSGLIALLGSASGYTSLTQALKRRKDRQRIRRYLDRRAELQAQLDARQTQDRRTHDLRLLEFRRKENTLEGVEKRELKSLQTALRHRRIHRSRQGQEHMPALALNLAPPGRKMNVHRARHRYKHSTKVYKSRDEHEGLTRYFNERGDPGLGKAESRPPTFEKNDRGKTRRR